MPLRHSAHCVHSRPEVEVAVPAADGFGRHVGNPFNISLPAPLKTPCPVRHHSGAVAGCCAAPP
ncbi:hypothetical protein C725_2912 [Pacificimonas flava]|uniref:Uncharacterized protein n=1 Tax=Pacificimonas flava TaxID=1234595 RepID=M2T5E3_9SPHN|nr:hypothetical protein C725_2912 [Pacificimonas flava]